MLDRSPPPPPHAMVAGHRFERTVIAAEQEARFEEDAWQEPIEIFLRAITRTTVLQIARSALGVSDIARLGMREQHRAAILIRLGWKRGARSHGGVHYGEPVTW